MLRNFDAFAKPVEGLRNSTTVGGIITILAYTSALILFFSQLVLYARVETKQTFQMVESLTSPYASTTMKAADAMSPGMAGSTAHGRALNARMDKLWQIHHSLPVKFKVTFPHVECNQLEVNHDDARQEDFALMHGKEAYTKRPPGKAEKEVVAAMSAKNDIYVEGCTVEGRLFVPKVGGMLSITLARSAWDAIARKMTARGMLFGQPISSEMLEKEFKLPNVSHYIHLIEFGDRFPLSQNPLEDAQHLIQNESGLGIANVAVKLVPTRYKRFARRPRDMYQVSVTDHMVHPNALALARSPLLPGLVVTYDFTPLAVHHTEFRENVFGFMSSLVSIVGGTFVTVGLVSRFLVNAASVAKKKD